MDLTHRIARLESDLERAEQLLLAVDNSRFFRALRRPGRIWRDWRGRLGQLLLHSRLHPWYLRLVPPPAGDDPYRRWAAQQIEPPPAAAAGPRISILMPVHNPVRAWLEEAVASVLRQGYPDWELCVADDGSRESWVREYFSAPPDPRIRFVRSDPNLGIAGATNLAGTLATGEYVTFLDQDDRLAPDALEWVAAALPADVVYSDEDRLDEAGCRVDPIFKPAWSPELLLHCMYMGHLLVVRREASGLRSGFDGAQDYDLALRLTEAGAAVRHIPRVLYHWRKHAGSTAAAGAAKPYTQAAGRAALAEAIDRRGLPAEIDDGPFPNTFRLRRKASGALASIVICSQRERLAERCFRALRRRTAYPHYEIILVEHLAGAPRMRVPVIRVPYTGPFDFASMNNLGARHASGEVLVFLNDDVIPLDPGWLEALVAQAERPEIGVAGARLVYPNGAIQHAGIAVGIGPGTGHPQRDTFGAGYWPWWGVTREVSAVTGACLAIRADLFRKLGGFDTRFPINYNDADLCLRARQAGHAVIYEAAAYLRHDECRTRRSGVRFAEHALWQQTWGGITDPYYSIHLDPAGEQAGLRESAPAPL